MITVLLAVDSATKVGVWGIAAAMVAGGAAWWGSHLSNRQATKDGQTAYFAALTDSQHVILEEKDAQLTEARDRIGKLEDDVRGLKREVSELHAENYRANRRAQQFEEKYDVALQEILSLRRQAPGD